MVSSQLDDLQSRLKVQFKNPNLLKHALTHRSAATENSLDSNERLEFLGDSVVGLIISESLFKLYPDSSEGLLAKSKAYIVSEHSLAAAALELGLDNFVELSEGEAATGGRLRRSILADVFEAVIAAVYLDCGLPSARRLIRSLLKNAIREIAEDSHRYDHKSYLQERLQASMRQAPHYHIVHEEGMDHDKTFTAQAMLGETVIGEGKGKSKKEAEQDAARVALERLPLPQIDSNN